MNEIEIPMGLGMALAQNPDAMQRFALLSEKEKSEIIARTHTIKNRTEMRRLAESI